MAGSERWTLGRIIRQPDSFWHVALGPRRKQKREPMSPERSSSDDRTRLPFAPGEPYCHHCGTPAQEQKPGPQDRCETCKLHLRHCRNCMFRLGTSCLLRSPHRWPKSGLPGQECPDFVWRDDELADTLDPDGLLSVRP